MMNRPHTPESLIGTSYSRDVCVGVDFGERWPLVTINADGTTGTIDEIVGSYDSDSDRWVLIDVQDGRVVRAGTGFESDAAALRSELLAAGLLTPEDA